MSATSTTVMSRRWWRSAPARRSRCPPPANKVSCRSPARPVASPRSTTSAGSIRPPMATSGRCAPSLRRMSATLIRPRVDSRPQPIARTALVTTTGTRSDPGFLALYCSTDVRYQRVICLYSCKLSTSRRQPKGLLLGVGMTPLGVVLGRGIPRMTTATPSMFTAAGRRPVVERAASLPVFGFPSAGIGAETNLFSRTTSHAGLPMRCHIGPSAPA